MCKTSKCGHHNVIKRKLLSNLLVQSSQRQKICHGKTYLQWYQGNLSKLALPWGLDFVSYIDRVFSLDDQNQVGKLSDG